MNHSKKLVGFWRFKDRYKEFPDVKDFIDPSWDEFEKEKVLSYVSNKKYTNARYRGYSKCRICGIHNGSKDFADGSWRWPEGLAHYIKEHNVKPEEEFLKHVLKKSEE